MAQIGRLIIGYQDNGKPQLVMVSAPLGADESTVLVHILHSYEGNGVADVDWTARDVETLRAQVDELGISAVTWEYL